MNKSQQAVDVFNRRADSYREKYMDVGLYADTLDALGAVLPPQAHVLELGCGPGNITQYLLRKRPDLKILATDLAPNMLGLAKAANPTAAFQLMDCRDIATLADRYDGIVCGFCLPYLSKAEAVQLMHDATTILNPAGVLYISTMEGSYSQSAYQTSSSGDTLFIHYHEADYLMQALHDSGFATIDVYRKTTPTDHDLILIARK